jgi:DNA polymerase mu
LSPDFVFDTYTRALEACTKRDLIPSLPDVDSYIVAPVKQYEPRLLSDSSDDEQRGRPAKRRKMDGGLPDMKPYDVDVELEDIPRYCVERPSPLVCVNQDLVWRLPVSVQPGYWLM